ncbi:unnamed protein product, partial [Polarella glacialis]
MQYKPGNVVDGVRYCRRHACSLRGLPVRRPAILRPARCGRSRRLNGKQTLCKHCGQGNKSGPGCRKCRGRKAAQRFADRAQSVAIFEAHWELLQPFVEHGLRDVARAHVAGVLDIPGMLVSWHAQRVLQQYHDLSRVFGAIADLRDARLVTAAEFQIHNLQSQLLQLELPTDHRAAHGAWPHEACDASTASFAARFAA